jgi:hypothetical protein
MVILSAWGNIHHCKNSERAETIAGLLALQAVLPNYGGLIHVENGCVELVSEVNLMQTSNSAYCKGYQKPTPVIPYLCFLKI